MVKCSKNHGNNKSMWCFCFERFCFHKFSWKLLTFNQREQSQFQLEMNVYCISWLRQISEFDCCSCPSDISFKFIYCCSPLVWIFLTKSYKIQGDFDSMRPSFSHGGQQAFNMASVMEDLDKNYLWLTSVEPLLIQHWLMFLQSLKVPCACGTFRDPVSS